MLQITSQWLSIAYKIKSQAPGQGFLQACPYRRIPWLTPYLGFQKKAMPITYLLDGKESSPQYQQSCFTVSRNVTAALTPGLWCSEPAGLTPDPTGHLTVDFQCYLLG